MTGYANGYVAYPQSGPFAISAFTYSPLSAVGYFGGFGNASYGTAIDGAGDIVGYFLNASSLYNGLYIPNGPDATLMPITGDLHSYAEGISPDGTRIVGYSTSSSSVSHATTWTPSQTTGTDFGSLGGANSYAFGVNDTGQVVGKSQNSSGVYHAFATDFPAQINPQTDDLGSQAGSSGDSLANAINGFNQIVGMTKTTSGPEKPFYKNGKADTSWRLPVMTTPFNTGDFGAALAVNDRGQMVGYANTNAQGTSYRAFIWIPNNPFFGLKDLNLFLTGSQTSQWVLVQATGINDAGRIVGHGLYFGVPTAFMLYPN